MKHAGFVHWLNQLTETIQLKESFVGLSDIKVYIYSYNLNTITVFIKKKDPRHFFQLKKPLFKPWLTLEALTITKTLHTDAFQPFSLPQIVSGITISFVVVVVFGD